jgi:hypothetical protein
MERGVGENPSTLRLEAFICAFRVQGSVRGEVRPRSRLGPKPYGTSGSTTDSSEGDT